MVQTSSQKSDFSVSLNGVSSFGKNIYLCHAIADNTEKSKANGAHVDAFKTYFISLIKRVFGSKIAVFQSGLKENEMCEAIHDSSVFFILLDSGFQLTKTLEKELKYIQDRCIDNDQDTLLIKILFAPVALEDQSPFLLSIPGINFFEKGEETDRIVFQANENRNKPTQNKQKKFADLVYKIEKFYQKADKNEPGGLKATVFLAETTSDQTANREIIKREIEQFGFKVLPENNLPEDATEFKSVVESDLKKSNLSVHIIGQEYGEIPKGEVHSFVDIQNKIASNIFREQINISARFSRLIWIPPDLKNTSDLQNLYIKKLKEDFSGLNKAEILQIPLEAFKTFVLNKLKSISNADIKNEPLDSKKTKVYLIFEKNDLSEVQVIINWLQQNNYETLTSSFFENDKNALSKHRENLVECDSVLIYKSGYNHSWLNSKLSDLLKAPGYGRKKPFSVKAIIVNQSANGLNKELLKGFVILHLNKEIEATMQAFQEHLNLKNE
jgi:Domain of unknown function (DUF4062)